MCETETNSRDVEKPQYEGREVRRSFKLFFFDLGIFLVGLSVVDQSTILPAFLKTLTDSRILIGAIVAVRYAGGFLPQLFAAHYLRNRRKHKSFIIKIWLCGRLPIFLFGVALLFARPTNTAFMLWGFVIVYGVFWFSDGISAVPWLDLIGKTIPDQLRGRLFGSAQVLGGLLGIGAGVFAGRMLSSAGPDFPKNYAVLWIACGILLLTSLGIVTAVREPEGVSEDADDDLFGYLKKIGRMLAGQAQLKRFIIVQLLATSFIMSVPFYVLYAKSSVGISDKIVGYLLSWQVAGCVAASAIAGFVSDRYSPRQGILVSVAAGVIAPVLALAMKSLPVVFYYPLFFAVGWILGSSWVVLTSYLLEMAEPQERRSYTGLMNTANAPTMLFPVIGGVIVQFGSYRALFFITAVVLGVAFILALGLRSKPRVRNTVTVHPSCVSDGEDVSRASTSI